jgi:hypothetical protein
MAEPQITWSQEYPGGRMLAQLGRVDIGAVFPPVGHPRDRHPWAWRFWLNGAHHHTPNGRAASEQAAKNALVAVAKDWLGAAGLSE